MLPTQNAPSGPTRPSFSRVFGLLFLDAAKLLLALRVAGSKRMTLWRSATTSRPEAASPIEPTSLSKLQETTLVRREVEPKKRAVQDIDEVDAVRPLVIDRALADPAFRVGDAGEVERHAAPERIVSARAGR